MIFFILIPLKFSLYPHRSEPKEEAKVSEAKVKSSSDTSFYIDLLCESFDTSDDLNSDYVAFEKKLFDDLKYKRMKKLKIENYVMEVYENNEGENNF